MTTPTENPRLRWLLRRGMKELDVVVTRYYERHFATASETERAAFVSLIETAEDPDIWAWVMDYQAVPAEYADVVERLRLYA
ncbi:MAG: succinate dehydrogenase assembly factor 2 [Hydrocarboniphaga sp.]|uniref:FAD assembly factor SdhE n=1 Tax=Hydrocarboniphaga sp. TaxID=2033016 RepID=UPI002625C5D9|nr:succinate dehydrogenase assembly factor 2 [Hydrocarboniphaga sp.]MDB5967938.1 succinate dehydrogenase assembly factor 2 [Hydrocarboniphaga sp.]